MGGQWGRTHGHLRSSTRMGAAGPHPVSLNISNGFRWGKGPGQVGMGTVGPQAPLVPLWLFVHFIPT